MDKDTSTDKVKRVPKEVDEEIFNNIIDKLNKDTKVKKEMVFDPPPPMSQ